MNVRQPRLIDLLACIASLLLSPPFYYGVRGFQMEASNTIRIPDKGDILQSDCYIGRRASDASDEATSE